ncbi:hypothetical protein E4U51_008585 [Claviceps purpurea]|nr:hypothetical protein E4U51_008585 [Claviceps purpurea]KAG6286819.1 hypothetical protein E4U45_008320 [Claviceps purpurea]
MDQQHDPDNLAGIPHVKIIAGSHSKTESAPVDNAVSDSANGLLAEPRHDTPGRDDEDESSDPLKMKSAAIRPCDELEQRPDEAPDRGSPTDEEEPLHLEDSDGPIDDQRGRGKRDMGEGIPPIVYTFSSDQETLLDPAC